MTYTSESHIKSVKDVKTFFHHIVSERKVNFILMICSKITSHVKVALTHSHLANVPYIIDLLMKVLPYAIMKEKIYTQSDLKSCKQPLN